MQRGSEKLVKCLLEHGANRSTTFPLIAGRTTFHKKAIDVCL